MIKWLWGTPSTKKQLIKKLVNCWNDARNTMAAKQLDAEQPERPHVMRYHRTCHISIFWDSRFEFGDHIDIFPFAGRTHRAVTGIPSNTPNSDFERPAVRKTSMCVLLEWGSLARSQLFLPTIACSKRRWGSRPLEISVWAFWGWNISTKFYLPTTTRSKDNG